MLQNLQQVGKSLKSTGELAGGKSKVGTIIDLAPKMLKWCANLIKYNSISYDLWHSVDEIL